MLSDRERIDETEGQPVAAPPAPGAQPSELHRHRHEHRRASGRRAERAARLSALWPWHARRRCLLDARRRRPERARTGAPGAARRAAHARDGGGRARSSTPTSSGSAMARTIPCTISASPRTATIPSPAGARAHRRAAGARLSQRAARHRHPDLPRRARPAWPSPRHDPCRRKGDRARRRPGSLSRAFRGRHEALAGREILPAGLVGRRRHL